MSSGSGGRAGFLVVLALVVVGGGLATVGWVDYARTNEIVASAEETEVTVLESSLSESGGPAEDRSYTVTIVYEYEVDGQTYQSSSVRPGLSDRSYSQRRRAQTLADKYPVGERRTGYVHPNEPDQSYLEQPSRADRLRDNALNAGTVAVGG
ncbi:DUF3592 domain-containing protein [Halovenus salina]|uniref:DUF3592 domain-containing protein n=2 Tax=Halovenus salina TaxID=1510225 RepID=A0ABD5VY47_9EURY